MLINCTTTNSGGSNSCTHAQDVGVVCSSGWFLLVKISSHQGFTFVHMCVECQEGDVRLLEGRSEFEGRVEICRNGLWGSVCHHGWDSADAGVVCRELGFLAIGTTYLTFSEHDSIIV